jgi:DNA-binding transcriptional MerR regulator
VAGPAAQMTIGEFSRRSQLSLKALRLYERLGLLRPVAVDPGNGYRRYHESQLYTARLIIMLRLLDMPLSEVGRVVSASGAEAAELIDAYWGSAERRFTAQRQVMASLRPGVAVSQMPAPELLVRERDVAEQTVLTEQRHVYLGQLAWIREAAARLTATAARCGGVAGERFVIFHGIVTADSDGPVEVCVPVRHPPDDPAELAWRVEAAHREAFIPVARAHFEIPAILSIYDQLARWVSAPGRRQAGAPREVYRPDAEPLFAAADQQICDVAVPFAVMPPAVAGPATRDTDH